MSIKGIAISSGVACGPVICFPPSLPLPIATDNHVSGYSSYEKARENALQYFNEYASSQNDISTLQKDLVQCYCNILNDPAINEEIYQKISDGIIPELAVEQVYQKHIDVLEHLSDPLFQERANDLRSVYKKLTQAFSYKLSPFFHQLDAPHIVVANMLTPADTIGLDSSKILALVTEQGGYTSHHAILARNLEIPAVSGIPFAEVKMCETLAVDGTQGIVWKNPSPEIRKIFVQKKNLSTQPKKPSITYHEQKAITQDGKYIPIYLNIESAQSFPKELLSCDGIGLFRTEFLFMKDQLPSEDFQYKSYLHVIQKASGKPVIIRTNDLGGDKMPSFDNSLKCTQNPFLGLRGIRYSLHNVAIFKDQLRAILRSAIYGDVRILLPMVSCIEEVRQCKQIIQQVEDELKREHVPFRSALPLGVMIETPAAALCADLFAQETDFASIGSNDLTQYTFAADRTNPQVSEYYCPLHPAILQLIAHVAKSFQKAKRPLCVCGEMASSPEAAPLLIGLGVTSLSLRSSQVDNIKHVLCRCSFDEISKLGQKALMMENEAAVLDLIKEYVKME